MNNIKTINRSIFVIILLALLSPISKTTLAQTEMPYYYVGQERVTLDISTQWMAVRFNSFSPSSNELEINSSGEIETINLGDYAVTLVPINALSSEDALSDVQTFSTSSDVAWATPVFNYVNRTPVDYAGMEDYLDPTNVQLVEPTRLILTEEFIAQFPDTMTESDIDAFNTQYGVIRKMAIFDDNTYLLQITSGSVNALEMANFYVESGAVIYAEPNFLQIISRDLPEDVEEEQDLRSIPNDAFLKYQWYLDNTGLFDGSRVDADMDIPEAWDIQKGSSDVIIAVVDDGVDLDHSDLRSKIVAPFDAVQYITGVATPYPYRGNGHGTSVAGLAAASTNNVQGMSGVCANCRIMPIRHAITDGSKFIVNSPAMTAVAIDYAWRNGADVINNSWGGGAPSLTVISAFYRATVLGRGGYGSVVVVSAGNSYQQPVLFPAWLSEYFPGVIAVGATTWCDTYKVIAASRCNGSNRGVWSWGNNWGPQINVSAPGHDLISTDITSSDGYASGDYTDTFGGTSGAAPLVSGVAGLLLSERSDLSASQVRTILERTSDDIGVRGFDIASGWGRVNANQALLAVSDEAPTNLQVTINRGRPTVTWDTTPNPTYFQVYVARTNVALFPYFSVYAEWLPRTGGLCVGNRCGVTLPIDLLNSTYLVYVRAWTPTSLGGKYSGWSRPLNFTISSEEPLSISSTNMQVVDGSTFTWQYIENATWYEIWIGNDEGVVHNAWYPDYDLGCSTADTCAVAVDLPVGSYTWYIRSWGPGGLSTGGIDGWSEGSPFVVSE